ncbi:ribonuclease T2 family protein [Thecamonas trahens ATCC 50062]|uniref:Ribonuclease T2 family protein n=1 Tax=Thecamonas trahens ATCC 50062 TaxID=461836 RepID=A0A0L0DAI0_THETB|nr:ribonuclease T2 family protein [Thecamonas trahens ATCC 50062]KNC49369.1 ribonuclease T2 family protein [Thecamonas trahens ATCC 50062]|eukprot:XP_013757794.1 ribonuclease T2 family protein [Thecamonas trahens ATCC 50062]
MNSVAVLLVALALALAVAPSASAAPGYVNWDFMVFRLMWPGSVSGGNAVPSGLNGFSIHGLWPTNNDTSGPSQCTHEAFDESQISSLLPEMNVEWASIWPDSKGNEGFWAHEWTKHGTCAAELSVLGSQYKFFNGVLQLKAQLKVLDALQSAGIYPSNSKTYTLDQIKSALTDAQMPPLVFCMPANKADGAETSSPPILQAIELCVDTSLNVYTCNDAMQKAAASRGHCWSDAIGLPEIVH